MNPRYRAGRNKEYAARKFLEARGASLVMRSAGSKGLADLCAVFRAVVWLVQVKATSKRGNAWQDANWKALKALPRPFNVWVYALVYRKGTAEPEVHHG
jgi:Holliday junction resolvase-like predicted endonuclease